MSFHFSLDLELFHLSFELCPTSLTTDGRQRDLDFHSFDDHPAFLGVMALFSTAMFFLTFEAGFRPGEDEEEDRDTLNITQETKGVTTFRDSPHLHSSETSAEEEKRSSLYGPHLLNSPCWPSYAYPNIMVVQYGPSKTCPRLTRSSALIPSLSAQTSTSQSRSGLFGQPHLHMLPSLGTSSRSTRNCFRRHPQQPLPQVSLCVDPRASTVRHPNNTISILFKRDNPLNPLNRASHLPRENGAQIYGYNPRSDSASSTV